MALMMWQEEGCVMN